MRTRLTTTPPTQRGVVPSLDTVQEILSRTPPPGTQKPNLVPLYRQISSDLITPSAAYLTVSAHYNSDADADSVYSFLFEEL